MNRDEATAIIFAEAFSEKGLVTLAQQTKDPGFDRMEKLISAISFLAEDLRSEDTFERILVAALFWLGTQMEELQQCYPPTSDSRCSFFEQAIDLQIAISDLIDDWENWPNLEKAVTYELPEPSTVSSTDSIDEEFEGYRVGDITYCVVGSTGNFFPVKVIRLGFNVVEVQALSTDICRKVCDVFLEERRNRCFQSSTRPAIARFGGFDERLVNLARQSGPELRLLPYHYATKTGQMIQQRHENDPDNWPLPTGTVFERWFKKSDHQ